MSTNGLFGHLYMSLHVQFSNLDILFQNSRPKFVIFDQAAIFHCAKNYRSTDFCSSHPSGFLFLSVIKFQEYTFWSGLNVIMIVKLYINIGLGTGGVKFSLWKSDFWSKILWKSNSEASPEYKNGGFGCLSYVGGKVVFWSCSVCCLT